MLQFIRSKAGSFFVKLLFVLLIGSFGLWGVGDLLRQGPRDTTLISVGSESFQGEKLQSEFQQNFEQWRQRSGGALDADQARALGLVDQTVDEMVAKALFDQEAKRLHVVIGDQQIASVIADNFKGPNGSVYRAAFSNYLSNVRQTEQQFVRDRREILARQTVGSAAYETPNAPKALVDTLYDIRNEHRIADYVFLATSAVKDLPAPDDAALQTYFDQHHDDFTAPEYRGFTALFMLNADVAAGIKIDEDKIKAAYDKRLGDPTQPGEYSKPETRHLLQMLLPDEATANQAEQALTDGKDFNEVAKSIAKQDASTVDLGSVGKADLPTEIADAAFDAKQGDVTKPVHSALGWHILKVIGIEAASVKSYDEAKPELEAELRADAEGEALDKLDNNVRDELSSGADLAAVAAKYSLKPITVAAVDATAKDPAGNLVSALPIPAAQVLKTVFDTADGQLSDAQDIKDGNGYYLVKVDKVTPPTLRPLDTVKDKVKEGWLAEQRTAKVAAQAKELADAVKPDMTLAKLAGTRKLDLKTTKPFTRTNEKHDAPLPSDVIAALFKGEIGTVASGATPDGQYVAQLKEIQPASPSTDANGTTQLKSQLDQELGSEMLDELQLALRDRYPVDIRHAAIDKLLGGNTNQ